jgi:hypothetical protein
MRGMPVSRYHLSLPGAWRETVPAWFQQPENLTALNLEDFVKLGVRQAAVIGSKASVKYVEARLEPAKLPKPHNIFPLWPN